MSPAAQNIANAINLYVRNYAPDAFANMRLNAILLSMLALADANAGGITAGVVLPLTSANFSNTTDCPIASTNGQQFALYWVEGGKFLLTDAGEWQYLTGGGFRILVQGFDSTVQNYHFYLYAI